MGRSQKRACDHSTSGLWSLLAVLARAGPPYCRRGSVEEGDSLSNA